MRCIKTLSSAVKHNFRHHHTNKTNFIDKYNEGRRVGVNLAILRFIKTLSSASAVKRHFRRPHTNETNFRDNIIKAYVMRILLCLILYKTTVTVFLHKPHVF